MEPRISSLLDDTFLHDKVATVPALGFDDSKPKVDLEKPAPVEPRFARRLQPKPVDLTFDKPAVIESSALTRADRIQISNGQEDNGTRLLGGSESVRNVKSGVPLAVVLNSTGCEEELPDGGFPEPRARKRQKADKAPAADYLTLPKPEPPVKASVRRPRIPPLLQGLHQPPPNAGLFPPITADPFANGLPKGTTTELTKVNGQAKDADIAPRETEEDHAGDLPRAERNLKRRRKWTDQETADLLQGVSRFGMGKWKQILEHDGYSFNGRTTVDLKDRFRTCCPEVYIRKGGSVASSSSKTKSEQQAKSAACERAVATPTATSLSAADTGSSNESVMQKRSRRRERSLKKFGTLIQGPFPNSSRRRRRHFTEQEDEALLRGFNTYGTLWHKIRDDQELCLQGRSATDLRDRFRNRYPESFTKAGYRIPKRKNTQRSSRAQDSSGHDGEPGKSATNVTVEEDKAPPSASHETLPSFNQRTSITKTPSVSIPDLFGLDGLSDLISPGPASPVTLNRRIFDWADQNLPQSTVNDMNPAGPGPPSDLHINPSVTVKPQRRSAGQISPGLAMPRLTMSKANFSDTFGRAGTAKLSCATDKLLPTSFDLRSESHAGAVVSGNDPIA